MGRAISGFFAQIILVTTIFSVSLFFTSLAGVLRILPQLVPLVGRAVWGLLILSCRFYFLVLGRIAEAIEQRWHIHVLEGVLRLATTTASSLLLGILLFGLLQWTVSIGAVLCFAFHGLFVGLIWEEIPDGDHLQMGEKQRWDNSHGG